MNQAQLRQNNSINHANALQQRATYPDAISSDKANNSIHNKVCHSPRRGDVGAVSADPLVVVVTQVLEAEAKSSSRALLYDLGTPPAASICRAFRTL